MSDIKLKAADPVQVTATMVDAIRQCLWADDTLREHAPELAHEINLALFRAGCLVFQVDTGPSGGTDPESGLT